MYKHLQSPLFFSIVAYCLIMYASIFGQEKFPEENVEFGLALLVHTFFSAFLLAGYYFSGLTKNKLQKKTTTCECNFRLFIIISILLSGIGLYASINSSAASIDFGGYLSNFMKGENNLRVAFELPSADGGAPGIFKILAFLINGIYAALAILLYRGALSVNRGTISMLFILLIFLLLKTSVFMDRATLLLAIIGFIFSISGVKFFKIYFSFVLITGFLILDHFSRLRLKEYGILDFISLYALSSVSNFNIVLTHINCIEFGLNTIFAVPNFIILKVLGLDLSINCVGDRWMYNPAQYFYSHVYLDFRYLSPLILMAFGIFVGKIEGNAKKFGLISNAMYLHLIVAILMMIGVTTLRGIEFYFSFFVTYLVLLVTTKERR